MCMDVCVLVGVCVCVCECVYVSVCVCKVWFALSASVVIFYGYGQLPGLSRMLYGMSVENKNVGL